MTDYFNSNYPSIDALRIKAKQRMPKFAFEYLDGGCFSEINLQRNTQDIRDIQLQPYYLRDYQGTSLKTELFGETYDAPFGMAPIGLQGLMWPKSCEILAQAAVDHKLPFMLSTVGTESIETIAEITEGKFWFQLYHPVEDKLRDQLLERAWNAGCRTLVILADTPTFAYRPKEIKNGLSIPPKMTINNILQMCTHPTWSLSQLAAGTPEFKTMKSYIPKGLNIKHLGMFMNKTFSGRLTEDKIKVLRDAWKGNLVIKGIVNPEEANLAVELGLDGLIVSNHGGRQLDSGQSTINALGGLQAYKGKIKIMMDSGLRSGPDIANALATGADFTFVGRAPMYGVGALGKKGGNHTFTMLKRQLQQVMEQVGCEQVSDFPKHLIKP
ncbi:alpha-hydroxy acid oxidase [Candidatus Thioglobus autotrophicus]|uniref:alpha-hydroxy acid oxidase n=1 Tax=Candidatus Thioglobus autotrophicus TaxID=1705394 RepID=UPI00299D2C68|nr:alpha-hydroxy acid oxidase [Candidatus Thioglobus autotrophicus]WPE16135.1 alpha-hydroxy acid oxidase [Candidatus Thioglobus autotrophicus]